MESIQKLLRAVGLELRAASRNLRRTNARLQIQTSSFAFFCFGSRTERHSGPDGACPSRLHELHAQCGHRRDLFRHQQHFGSWVDGRHHQFSGRSPAHRHEPRSKDRGWRGNQSLWVCSCDLKRRRAEHHSHGKRQLRYHPQWLEFGDQYRILSRDRDKRAQFENHPQRSKLRHKHRNR